MIWVRRAFASSRAVPNCPLFAASMLSEPSELMSPLEAVLDVALGDALKLEIAPRFPSRKSPGSASLGLINGRLTVPSCRLPRPLSTVRLRGSAAGAAFPGNSDWVVAAPTTSSPSPSAQSQCPCAAESAVTVDESANAAGAATSPGRAITAAAVPSAIPLRRSRRRGVARLWCLKVPSPSLRTSYGSARHASRNGESTALPVREPRVVDFTASRHLRRPEFWGQTTENHRHDY